MARQVFIEQLSHWGTGEEAKDALKKVPIPGKVKVQLEIKPLILPLKFC